MPTKNKKVFAILEESLHRRFKALSATQGLTMTAVMTSLVEKWVENGGSWLDKNEEAEPNA